ncbi:TPA: sensor histidine kinase [Staphylococcus delphini]|nr:sensor histidine kinase [Staphylococcus delphini]HEC2188523.1 sensor histidine kinase [Staphylococcus delphini]HEC2191002.1 sensor histidine kinase [Staphylococcus delphini]HEC2192558.1 sensor histidine kinase [Staphylococcus delphini]HEC2200422.1 sensor histidine kinase [Staphylococcus delphini]
MIKKLDLHYLNLSSLLYLLFPILNLWSPYHHGRHDILVVVTCLFVIVYTVLVVGYPLLSHGMMYTLLLCQYGGIIYFVYAMSPMTALFLFYSAFAIPYVFKVTLWSKEYFTFFATIVLCIIVTAIYYPAIYNIITLIVFFTVIHLIMFANFKKVEQQQYESELETKNKQLNFLIAEHERNRIGQDLHDTLGHVFAALSLKSELALKLIDTEPERAKSEIQSLNAMSKASLNQIRTIINALKIPSFSEEVASIETLLKDAYIQFHFEGVQLAHTLSPAKQALLAMVLREAMNNIIKHADATTVHATLSEAAHRLKLDIQDNGRGMTGHPPFHLESIQARVDVLKGELHVQNNEGLHIQILIPRSVTL